MRKKYFWQPCVEHQDSDVEGFFKNYFSDSRQNILLIGGAGFDPRATIFARKVSDISARKSAVFIRENRPAPDIELLKRAEENISELKKLYGDTCVLDINIFTDDKSIIGGHEALKAIQTVNIDGITDIIIDISALSIGTAFPLIKYYITIARESPTLGLNIHIVVAHNPILDEAVEAISSDKPNFIHGFDGGYRLSKNEDAAKLWLPQLSKGRKTILSKLYDFLQPNDTCPILPFPAKGPRAGDELLELYTTEIEEIWQVDSRSLVYAAEDDALDLYRTILRLDDLRKPVFDEIGGSMLILSPSGKIMALGSLMAALERNLPVAYIEALQYNLKTLDVPETTDVRLVHVWLEGDVYKDHKDSA